MKYRAQKMEQLTIDGNWEIEHFVVDEKGRHIAKCWKWEDAQNIAAALNAAVLTK